MQTLPLLLTQELLLIFTYLIWCILVKCQRFSWIASPRFNEIMLSPCFAWHEQEMDADGAVLDWMRSLLHTDANERKNCWMWLFEVASLVGLLIIKSCIDLICSLLMFKQLIISNPMTHLLLKWNMFKRSLCTIGLVIYAVRWQLTDFVYSSLMFRAKCALTFSLWMSVW